MFKKLRPYIVIGEKYRRPGWKSDTEATTKGDNTKNASQKVAETGGGSTEIVREQSNPDDAPTPLPKQAQTPAPKYETRITQPFDPNALDAAGFVALGFSQKQAEVIIKYRYKLGGFTTPDDLAHCFVVSKEAFARIAPYIVIAPKSAKTTRNANRTDSTKRGSN